MDFEKSLVDKVVQTSNIEALLSSGIREHHFLEDKHKEIYRFMVDHFRKYKVSPTMQTMREEFPEVLFELNQESLEYLTDKFPCSCKASSCDDSYT